MNLFIIISVRLYKIISSKLVWIFVVVIYPTCNYNGYEIKRNITLTSTVLFHTRTLISLTRNIFKITYSFGFQKFVKYAPPSNHLWERGKRKESEGRERKVKSSLVFRHCCFEFNNLT